MLQKQEFTEHEISDETAQLSQEHAQKSLKHGKTVEKMGKLLQKRDKDRGKSIEEKGKEIQEHAKASLKHAQDAEHLHGDATTRSYNLAAQEHVKQVQAHIQANKEYSKILDEQIEQSHTVLAKNQQFLE